ncbi:hypothetical protein [Acinetobacter oleivorans]|uniref:hypothetical protein n=1 Tax=Acinetobacter oleivorans TaxID=1148157 RepID=UPI003A8822EF
MLFNADEIDQLVYFKNTTLILNTIYLAFKRFDVDFSYPDRPIENIKIDISDELLKFKNIITKVDEILRHSNKKYSAFESLIVEFNSLLVNSFALYESDNSQFVQMILLGFYNILEQVKNLFNAIGFDFLSEIPELLDFTQKWPDLKNNQMVANVKLNEVNYNADFFNDLYQMKREVLDLKDKYNQLIIEHHKGVSIFIDDQREFFRSTSENLMVEFREYILQLKNKYNIEAKADIDSLNKKIQINLLEMENLYGDINSYKSIVSKETENEISKYYSAKAKDEKRTYWWATIISVIIIIFAIVTAWKGLDNYYQNYVSVTLCQKAIEYKECIDQLFAVREASKSYALLYLIMRLIFSLLLFLTVIYTSRIAIRAYNHWRHSENMHLKLASLRPFINQLSTDDRAQIHKDLVPDYFGKDAGLVDNQGEKFKDLPANVSAVAMKAIEQISGSGSNSSIEKNGKKSEGGTE